MAASFWESPHARGLVDRQQLRSSHALDRGHGLSEEQVEELSVFYTSYQLQLARSMQVEQQPLVRARVAGTAALYFRRFYLARDFCQHDPLPLALAALLLAGKTEECSNLQAKLLLHYARRLAAKTGAPLAPPPKQLARSEAELLEELQGDLLVFSPFPTLAKLLRDVGLSQDRQLADSAWAMLNDTSHTPLALLHPPHILALGCLVLAATVLEQQQQQELQKRQEEQPRQLHPQLQQQEDQQPQERQPGDSASSGFGEGSFSDGVGDSERRRSRVHDVGCELLAFYAGRRQPISPSIVEKYLLLLRQAERKEQVQ